MNNWLKDLPPVDYIYLLGGALLLVLIIIILVYVMKISREIAGKTLRMSEEVLFDNEQLTTNLKIINHSYHENDFNEIGMIYKKRKVIIQEENVKVIPRSKEELLVTHDKIRELLQIDGFKIKRLRFYFENSLGKIIKISGRITRKEIKKALKQEKLEFKEASKEERYEQGQFTGGDRFVIFFENLFAPIKKASHNSKVKRNKKIADKRVEKEVEREREQLIEAQKLIYEQQVRETRKEELRKEYKIDELKENLDKLEEESKLKEETLTAEEIVGLEPKKKGKKNRKKQKEEIIEEPIDDNEINEDNIVDLLDDNIEDNEIIVDENKKDEEFASVVNDEQEKNDDEMPEVDEDDLEKVDEESAEDIEA